MWFRFPVHLFSQVKVITMELAALKETLIKDLHQQHLFPKDASPEGEEIFLSLNYNGMYTARYAASGLIVVLSFLNWRRSGTY